MRAVAKVAVPVMAEVDTFAGRNASRYGFRGLLKDYFVLVGMVLILGK
jgi:hypothetical protein